MRKQNDELRKLIIDLSIVILKWRALEGGSSPKLLSTKAPPSPEEMSPSEMVLHLRDAAMQCAQLSRASTDCRVRRESEDLSIKLADIAQRMNTLLIDAGTIR